jgi:uncharacterized damage-inducible protein DinB
MTELTDYKYRGARALVLLHEQYLSEFYDVWREAKEADLRLPQVDDPDYESLDHVLRHVLRAARGYMTWMCQVLGLPDPEIRATPEVERIESEAVDYLDHVLEQWRVPLSQVDEKSFNTVAKSRWDVEMAVESMLEHAVMHPIRHTFQLQELMKKQTN